MADLEFTVAMIGQQQAEKGLDALSKKSQEVAKSEKVRERATEAANKAASKPVTAGGAAKALGKAGGMLGQAGGLGEVANLGAVLGPVAAGAAALGAGFKILTAVLSNETRLALERVQGRIAEANMERQAASMRSASGVKALGSQGANLVRLESLGPGFTSLANDVVKRLGVNAPEAQKAVLQASTRDYTMEGVKATIEAASKLSTLTGDTLDQSVKALQEFSRRTPDDKTIAAILSNREGITISELTVKNRLRAVAESRLAQGIGQAQGVQAQTTLAEQGNLPYAMEALTKQLIEVQNPLMSLQAEAYRENSIKVEALSQALGEQGFLARAIDRLTNGVNSLSGQYAAAQRAMAGGRSDPTGEIPTH